ncbi:MAG: hypothetical protein P1P88_19150 [Bacteroidales bacterium]|nr:hypothetical protein [Bacteroidales bacterium]
MRTILYTIGISLLIIWGLLIWGFNVSYKVHILVVIATIIIAFAVFYDKKLSDRA